MPINLLFGPTASDRADLVVNGQPVDLAPFCVTRISAILSATGETELTLDCGGFAVDVAANRINIDHDQLALIAAACGYKLVAMDDEG